MFKRILVALDDSPQGQQIFSNALALAKALQAELTLLQVLTDWSEGIRADNSLYAFAPLGQEDFAAYFKKWDDFEERQHRWLQKLAGIANAQGVPTHISLHTGDPGRCICTQAREADLVVVGRRGHRGLNELLLGSVSNYVLHHCPCPVWVIQGPMTTLPQRWMVALDANTSPSVVAQILPLIQVLKGNLNLVHVLSSQEEGSPTLPLTSETYGMGDAVMMHYQKLWQDYVQRGLNLLNTYQKEITTLGLPTETTQLQGRPGIALCAQAEAWKADLIVMGRRGYTGLSEFFLGSVSNYVLHHSPCSVLVVNVAAPTVPVATPKEVPPTPILTRFNLEDFIAKVTQLARQVNDLLEVSAVPPDCCTVHHPGFGHQLWVRAALEGQAFQVMQRSLSDPPPEHLSLLTPVGEEFLRRTLEDYASAVGCPPLQLM